MALLFVLSAIPGAKYPAVGIRNIDKAVHICLYSPLGAGFFAVLRRATAMGLGPTWGAAVLSTTIYGSLDELHQWFVPGRSCDWHDLVADFIGGSIGALALAWRTYRFRRSDRNNQAGLE